jgi:glutaredoxin
MANKIVVFTLNGCGHCVELKTKFKENHIPFQEIEIGSNQKLWDQVVNQTGHNSLPTVFVG